MAAPQRIASDHIRELLYPFSSYEIVLGGVHRVRHMGLLDQIENTVTGAARGAGDFHAAYGSKPAGRLDCLDFMARIKHQSFEMLPEPGLRHRLRALSVSIGLTQNSRVRSWWSAASVLTQHEVPSAALTALCPSCDRFVTLHVRLNPNVAVCVGCGETWTDERFYELGDWVRWNGDHPGVRGAETGVGLASLPEVCPESIHRS